MLLHKIYTTNIVTNSILTSPLLTNFNNSLSNYLYKVIFFVFYIYKADLYKQIYLYQNLQTDECEIKLKNQTCLKNKPMMIKLYF